MGRDGNRKHRNVFRPRLVFTSVRRLPEILRLEAERRQFEDNSLSHEANAALDVRR